MPDDCQYLKKRFDQVKTDRSPIEGIWELIEQYVVPFSSKVYGSKTEAGVDWRRRDIYDSTAITANEELASNLQSGLTNFAFKWFDFVFRDKKLNKDTDARQWLQVCSDRVFETLQDSNFELESGETFHNLPSYGSGPTVEEVEEDDSGSFKELVFSSIPVSEAYFEEDHKNNVVYFYRELSWTPLQIKTKFGEDALPDKIKAKMDKAGSEAKFTVIFCVYPREDKEANTDKRSVVPEERPFGYKYFVYETAEQLGKEGGYYEMPADIPRWRRTSTSQWGHSPAMVCLSDILSLNQLVELILTAGEKAVDPPILGTQRGVFGDVDLRAGGYTVVKSDKSLIPFESKARFDVSQLNREELQASIRAAFFADKLELKKSPEMTATEVQARLEIMARLMGPAIARIQTDFLDRVLKRTFKILYRYNLLPPMPDSVREAQAELDVEYRGPMARAQRMDKVSSIERWVGMIAEASQIYPGMADVPEAEEAAREIGFLLGVPVDLIRPQSKVSVIQKQRQQIQELMQQLEMAKQGAEAFRAAAQGGAALQPGQGQPGQGGMGGQPGA